MGQYLTRSTFHVWYRAADSHLRSPPARTFVADCGTFNASTVGLTVSFDYRRFHFFWTLTIARSTRPVTRARPEMENTSSIWGIQGNGLVDSALGLQGLVSIRVLDRFLDSEYAHLDCRLRPFRAISADADGSRVGRRQEVIALDLRNSISRQLRSLRPSTMFKLVQETR